MNTEANRLKVLAISTRAAEGAQAAVEATGNARPDDQQNAGDGGSDLPTLLPHGGSTAAYAAETDNGCGATSAGGESGLPHRLLDWVMEHTDAGYRVGSVHGVHWLDPRDGRGYLTRAKTYEDAIAAAASECAAIDAASEQGAEVAP